MQVIDEKGRVLGLINVLDLVAVLVVLVVAAGAVAFVVGDSPPPEPDLTVVVETSEPPFVTNALEVANGCDRGATIEHVLIENRIRNETRGIELHRLRVTARVAADRHEGGWTFDGRELWVGGPIELDLCSVRVDGTVVQIMPGEPEIVDRETANGTIDLGDLPCDPEGGVCVCFELNDELMPEASSESCIGGEDRGE